MALYSLDIEKELAGEFWTNRYILDVASALAGASPAAEIIEAERQYTLDRVNFTRYRISSVATGDDDYIIVPIDLEGGRTAGVGSELPLFCTLRVDFTVTSGRPSRKYYRGILIEADQTSFGELDDAFLGFFNAAVVDTIAAVEEYVDVDGQAILSGAAYPKVAMRQLRRGSRRRTTPIL